MAESSEKAGVRFEYREKIYEILERDLGADVLLLSHLGKRVVVTYVPDSQPPVIAGIRESNPYEFDILSGKVKSGWASFIRNSPARDRMWYDCVEGLREALAKGITLMDIQLYRKTAFIQNEELREFYIKGEVFLMRTGDVVEADPYGKKPRDLMPDIPDVIECSAFWGYLNVRRYKGQELDAGFKPWYDSRDGIESSLITLKNFSGLVAERQKAADRHEKLTSYFCMRGKFLMHKDGTLGITRENFIGKTMPREMPSVVDVKEYLLFLEVRGIKAKDWYGAFLIPKESWVCPLCKQGWYMYNLTDYEEVRTAEDMPLDDFVGKTLAELAAYLKTKTDAYYWLDWDHPIKNPKFIDMSPMFPEDLREGASEIKVNDEGFHPDVNRESVGYVIQPGDVARIEGWRYYHKECHRKNLWIDWEKKFKEAFLEAGFPTADMRLSRDKFEDKTNDRPEFSVDTGFGVIRIGWTSGEGILIRWPHSEGDRTLELFKDENTRKGEGYIFASQGKFKGYLKKLRLSYSCCLDIGSLMA